MPWSFPDNIPRPALNWTESEQKRCIAAANAALRDGETEQNAIFACIHAAGKSVEKQSDSLNEAQVEMYEEERSNAEQRLLAIADLYLIHAITVNEFRERIRQELKTYYIRLALIAREGDDLSEWDLRDIAGALIVQYDFLDGFADDLMAAEAQNVQYSDRYVLWRASLYSLAWDRMVRHSLPDWLVDILPALPGVDCLGGAACGCQLAWEVSGDEVEVYWLLDPFKEHCINCLSLAMEWQPMTLELPMNLVEF